MDNLNNKSNRACNDQVVSLFLQHYNLVRLIAFESAPCHDLVDDIVNDSFVAFVATPEKWDLTQPIQPLLRKITKNIALQYWKKRTREMPSVFRELAEILRKRCEIITHTNEEYELTDKLQALESCMSHLSDEQRQLLEEFYVDAKTFVELEKKYKRRANTLQKVVSRLRISLERCVQKTLRRFGGKS